MFITKLMEPLNRDPYLWQKAKTRTKFQSHLVVYTLVNGGLWLLWALTPQPHAVLPWPVWSTAFWGVGLVMNGFAVFGDFGREQRTQREYKRLVRERQPNGGLR